MAPTCSAVGQAAHRRGRSGSARDSSVQVGWVRCPAAWMLDLGGIHVPCVLAVPPARRCMGGSRRAVCATPAIRRRCMQLMRGVGHSGGARPHWACMHACGCRRRRRQPAGEITRDVQLCTPTCSPLQRGGTPRAPPCRTTAHTHARAAGVPTRWVALRLPTCTRMRQDD